MRIATSLGVGLIVLALAGTSFGEEGKLQAEVKMAKSLESRKPVEPGDAFSPGKVYCWNVIKGGQGDFKVIHVWYKEGKEVWKQPLSAKGAKWTTWSHHKVSAGSWKVEVTDEAGKAIQTAQFTVK